MWGVIYTFKSFVRLGLMKGGTFQQIEMGNQNVDREWERRASAQILRQESHEPGVEAKLLMETC